MLLYPALVAGCLGTEPRAMDQCAFCLAPVVGNGPVDASRFAFTARNSVANAEDSDDGLFPLAGGRQIVIAHGTAVFMTHLAPDKTARNGRCGGISGCCMMFVGKVVLRLV